MRITGRFKGCFLSVHMANLLIASLARSEMKKVVSSLVVLRSEEFREEISWSTMSPAPVEVPKLIARRDYGCLAVCML